MKKGSLFQKYITTSVFMVVMCFGMWTAPQTVAAQTADDLQTEVNMLLERIRLMELIQELLEKIEELNNAGSDGVDYDQVIIDADETCQSTSNTCVGLGLDNDLFEIDINYISENLTNSYDGELKEAGLFTFSFDLTAVAADVYIDQESFNVIVSVGEKADFMYDDDVLIEIREQSTADEDGGDYVVPQGSREEFVVEVYYNPVVEGNYAATFYGFDFRVENSDTYSVDLYPERPESEFIPILGVNYNDWLDEDNEDVEIVSFTANDETSLYLGPVSEELEFVWKTEGVSNCSLFVDGSLIKSGVGINGNYTYTQNGWKDGDTKNVYELRCQNAYTQKDSTVSEYVYVYFDRDEESVLDAEMRIIIHDATAAGTARNGKSISLDGGTKVASGQWFDMFDSDIWYTDSTKLIDNAEDYQAFEGLVVERDGAKGNRFTIAHVGENDSTADYERIQATVEVRGTNIAGVTTSSFENHQLTTGSYGTYFNKRSDYAEKVSDTKVEMVTFTNTGSDFVEVEVDYAVATVLGASTSPYAQLTTAVYSLEKILDSLESMN